MNLPPLARDFSHSPLWYSSTPALKCLTSESTLWLAVNRSLRSSLTARLAAKGAAPAAEEFVHAVLRTIYPAVVFCSRGVSWANASTHQLRHLVPLILDVHERDLGLGVSLGQTCYQNCESAW